MKPNTTSQADKVSDEDLEILIDGLQKYKDDGVIDPWVLGDGTQIEPLDLLKELRELRLVEPTDDIIKKTEEV